MSTYFASIRQRVIIHSLNLISFLRCFLLLPSVFSDHLSVINRGVLLFRVGEKNPDAKNDTEMTNSEVRTFTLLIRIILV